LLLFLLSLSLAQLGFKAHHYPKGYNTKRPERIQEALKNKEKYPGCCVDPVSRHDFKEFPRSFDWCNVHGKSYCTQSWNQHQPKYCGSCYVHGTLAAVQDRIKVLKKGEGIDVTLGRQVILNCGKKYGYGDGCNGGESPDIFEFMRLFGLPDETCNNYLAESMPCPETGEGFCQNCMMFGDDVTDYKCWAVDKYTKYHVKAYGYVDGEENIFAEVLARGPITCGMVCPDEFVYGYDGGIYRYKGNETDMDHDVEIVGWGEENGIKYWKIRNSWGSYWGENGFFRLVRGENNMRIEENCVFALPEFKEEKALLDGKVEGSMFGLRPVIDGVPPHKMFPKDYVSPPPPEDDENKKEKHVAKKEKNKNNGSSTNLISIAEEPVEAVSLASSQSSPVATFVVILLIVALVFALFWLLNAKRQGYQEIHVEE